jgi:hypothetical protein
MLPAATSFCYSSVIVYSIARVAPIFTVFVQKNEQSPFKGESRPLMENVKTYNSVNKTPAFLYFCKNTFMDTTTMLLCLAIAVLIGGFLAFLFWQQRKSAKDDAESSAEGSTRTLRLQAYERLTLLVDRIALPNLISRVSQGGLTAREMQLLLTRSIKEEFDYNITQQIYVSPDAWTAVKNLKEQNILVVNQLAGALPPHATGLDLNKLLLEFLMKDKKGQLHEVVSEVLSYEAKKLL